MTDLQITTVNDFDTEGVFPLRTIRAGGKTIRTPAAANLPGKLQKREDVHPDSRGVNELYRTAGGDDIDEAMNDPDGGKLNRELASQFERTSDDELNVTFTKYTETSTLGPAHARYLVELHAKYSDVIAVPMMTKLVRNVEDGLSDPHYRSFKKSVVAFLNQAEELHPDKPVMGLIPRLGWEFIEDLMQVYEAHDVLAYAFDFNRCKVTTGAQLAMIRPLMQSIANRGVEEHVLFYAINPSPGVRNQTLGFRPASDIASFGLGFDIVGGRHVTPPMSEEAFEQMGDGQGEDEEPNFRLFDRDEWIYREIPVSNLPEIFPEVSAFDATRVAARVRRSPENAKYRLQQLVNSEQQALAAADLRDELESGNAYSSVRRKRGVTEQAQEAFIEVREEFDEERFQTGLGEF